jgi:hypothetical protein
MTLLTFNYDPKEDRILVGLNAGSPDERGYWLTRRLVLELMRLAHPFLDKLSQASAKTPPELRADLRTMETEVALALTEQSLGQTPIIALRNIKIRAELAIELKLTPQGNLIAVSLRGAAAEPTVFNCTRVELRRVMHTIQCEAMKAKWLEAPLQTAADKPGLRARVAN